ncbi:MAG: hypothetical protein ACLSUT_06350 [Christensenellales bacterium]
MGKYDGISKVDAVVRTAEEPAEKKSRGYLFSLAVRTVCAAAIVALLFLGKWTGFQPLRDAGDYVRRAVEYDVGLNGDEELGYSEIASYFYGDEEKA